MPGESTINAGVRTFDAIVLGAGPGGAATSLFLHDAALAGDTGRSLRSLLVDVRPELATRENVVLLQPEVIGDFTRMGVLGDIAPSARDIFGEPGASFGVASLARIDNVLRAKVREVGAAGGGIEAAYESTLEGVRHLPDRSIEATLVRHDGSRETIRAAALVDATGGRSGLFRKATESEPKFFLTGHRPTVDGPAYSRTELAPKTGEANAPWLLQFNHSVDGESAFVQLPTAVSAGVSQKSQARSLAGYVRRAETLSGTYDPMLAERLPVRFEGVHVVKSTTNVVADAAEDGVYGVGDTVGNGSPVYGNGVKLAFDDAKVAAAAIRNVVDTGLPTDAPSEAIAQVRAGVEDVYDQMVRFQHTGAAVQPPALA